MQSFWDRKWMMFVVLMVVVILVYFNRETDVVKEDEGGGARLEVKQAEIISFGDWHLEENRAVLATVESDQEVDVSAEIMGVIDKVFVGIGGQVQKNQVLASYKRSADPTQIHFENALRNLNTTKWSSENLVKQAQISLDSVRREHKQTQLNEAQNKKQAFDRLKIQAKNSEVLISHYLNWIDRLLGATNDYRYEWVQERESLGAQDKVGKQDVKNGIIDLVQQQDTGLVDLVFEAEEVDIFDFSETRFDFLEKTKALAILFDDLVHGTMVTSSISENQLSLLWGQSSVFLDKLNAEILALENAIESGRGAVRRAHLSLTASDNRIQSALANLTLANSNAQAQVENAQSQYLLAESSQQDLDVRAPFRGKIIQKNVSEGVQVTPGSRLFSLLSDAGTLRVVAFLAPEELQKIQEKAFSEIVLADGTVLRSSHNASSIRIDPMTQKVRVEFSLEKRDDIFVGALVKVLLPVNGTKKNLIPLSALSFEPAGEEVLVVNAEGVAERRTIQIGNTVSNTVEVVSGLEMGERVVQYRNRVFSGEKVESSGQ